MLSDEQHTETPAPKAQWFTTTQWSVVLAAAASESADGKAALEQLCRTYWFPLYAFLRRDGKSKEEAEDLAQGFFDRLLRLDSLAKIQRGNSKFRSFLLESLKHFLLDEHAKASALKRGGGQPPLSLDQTTGEGRYCLEPVDPINAEEFYDLEWARTVFEQAGKKLEEEYRRNGKSGQYQNLRAILTKETNAPSYAELAVRSGRSEGTIKSEVSRLRKRFRELIREEVASTVSDSIEIDGEFGHLIRLLQQGGTNWRA